MKRYFFISILFLVKILKAQNVTIDYEAWNPSNPPCDVFQTSVSPFVINVPATGATGGILSRQSRCVQPSHNTTFIVVALTLWHYLKPYRGFIAL